MLDVGDKARLEDAFGLISRHVPISLSYSKPSPIISTGNCANCQHKDVRYCRMNVPRSMLKASQSIVFVLRRLKVATPPTSPTPFIPQDERQVESSRAERLCLGNGSTCIDTSPVSPSFVGCGKSTPEWHVPSKDPDSWSG
jgi:hypothetical protein